MTRRPAPTALAALAAGAVVVLVLLAELAGAPLDLLDVTLGGLAVALLCGMVSGLLTGTDRRVAAAGLGLSLVPALVLAVELARG